MTKPSAQPKGSGGTLPQEQFFNPLQEFAGQIKAKFSAPGKGEPENQLRSPVERLFSAYGGIISRKIVLQGESALADRLGKPDFAAYDGKILIGYIELKAPGKGANPEYFKGHDLEQWKRFQNIPNLIYTDGNEWGLFRSGKQSGKTSSLQGDVRTTGKSAATEANAAELFHLFAEFSSWSPIVPTKPKELAAFLAPFCRLIREEVVEALSAPKSPLRQLRDEIKKLLFPEASDRQFSDAYAQTVVFALLLAHLEGADVLELPSAYQTLSSHHLLLSRSLQFLTDPSALAEISSSVSLAQRIIHAIPMEVMKDTSEGGDPWLFFYEHFLAAYDPQLRKAWGVYYTPVEVVRCQVRLIDEILTRHFGRTMGFVEPYVSILDPAAGTGTYILTILDHALKRVAAEEGPGAVRGGARNLANNLYGFEWMVGPYAVAQLRYVRALTAYGSSLPKGGPGIYLTNTLESPHTHPPAPTLFHQPIAQEHANALRIKESVPILVCLGNPPYGRHEASEAANRAVTGGWVRYGGPSDPAILEDFLKPAREAGFGVHLKNLYNLYVYFIRWALWKVFENRWAYGPGIVSFITASSYLDGDAFAGMREHMRRVCDHIDIIDLGGEGRGTRQEENVFAIQTPVCILIAWREDRRDPEKPGKVRYVRISGTREEKLKALDSVTSYRRLDWQEVPDDWQAAFKPALISGYNAWPKLIDLFPWQQSGVEIKRSWPIAPETDVLNLRWKTLVAATNKAELFKESRDRKVSLPYPSLFRGKEELPPLEKAKDEDMLRPIRYAYRSFDRQWVIPDNRIGDYFRPSIWNIFSEKQLFLTSLFNHPLSGGPALTVTSLIPDRHHFRGSYGGKDILPLYRDQQASSANIIPSLLDILSEKFGKQASPEDFAGYVYSILAHPEYTARFEKELAGRHVRVPLTKDSKLFFKAAEFGKALIWLHTYGERMADRNRPKGKIPTGAAKCLKAVSEQEERYPNEFDYNEKTRTLTVGDGSFGPVGAEVFEFEVSGFKVVKSWLGYRMRERSGKKSSPLDDIRPKVWTRQFTRELLELLWVLEKTVEGYKTQKRLLEEVLAGPLFKAAELPPVSEEAREAPKVYRMRQKGQEEFDFAEWEKPAEEKVKPEGLPKVAEKSRAGYQPGKTKKIMDRGGTPLPRENSKSRRSDQSSVTDD